MEITERQIDVEQIKRLLQKRRTSSPRFRLSVNQTQAEELLIESLQNEVCYRNCIFSVTPLIHQYITQVAEFLTTGTHFGLLLCGLPGNGKTTFMRAIARLINVCDFKDDHGDDFFVRFISSKDIVSSVKKDYKSFKSICDAPALAIDDFGEEPLEVLNYGNVINPVIDLLSDRYDKQRFTIITTNTANRDIRKNYGNRIADRFNEMMKVIIFTNPSYRGNNNSQH